jgi:hypothetical protein
MAVEAVSAGIVSGSFPENGKSTGNHQGTRQADLIFRSNFTARFRRGMHRAAAPIWFVPHDGDPRQDHHDLLRLSRQPATRFQRVKAPDKSELEDLVQLINQRVGRCLKRQGLPEQDIIDSILAHLRKQKQDIPTLPLLAPPSRAPPETYPIKRAGSCLFSPGRARGRRVGELTVQPAGKPLNTRWHGFLCIAEPEKTAAKNYGVLNMFGMANRNTFYIGKDGRILKIDKDIAPKTSAEDMARTLGELGVAPAKTPSQGA